MEQMIRKQIYLKRTQQARLKRLAKQRGVSEAEIIRRALDQELTARTTPRVQRDPEAWGRALQFMLDLRARGPQPEQRRDWKREDAYAQRLSLYERHTR